MSSSFLYDFAFENASVKKTLACFAVATGLAFQASERKRADKDGPQQP